MQQSVHHDLSGGLAPCPSASSFCIAAHQRTPACYIHQGFCFGLQGACPILQHVLCPRYIFQRAADVSPETEKAVAAFNAQLRKRKAASPGLKQPSGAASLAQAPSNKANRVEPPQPEVAAAGAAATKVDPRLLRQLQACQKVGADVWCNITRGAEVLPT